MAHAHPQVIVEKLKQAAQLVDVGGTYRHYRNPESRYRVLHLAVQEATEAVCVVYQALYGDQFIWVRNLDDWRAKIKMPDGQQVSRFEKL